MIEKSDERLKIVSEVFLIFIFDQRQEGWAVEEFLKVGNEREYTTFIIVDSRVRMVTFTFHVLLLNSSFSRWSYAPM
jgi:hypothetical protein